jgi:glycogen operon protein
VKNLITVTLLSAGMPMLLMGDEVRRTQHGNNNAYCQDDETSWFDWTLVQKRADLLRFVSLLNAHRALRDVEHERHRLPLDQVIRQARITWHGVQLDTPDWGDSSHSVAFTARLAGKGLLLHVILNAYWEPLEFELPPVAEAGAHPWRRWIDTFLPSPDDIVELERVSPVAADRYRAEPSSVVVLFAAAS